MPARVRYLYVWDIRVGRSALQTDCRLNWCPRQRSNLSNLGCAAAPPAASRSTCLPQRRFSICRIAEFYSADRSTCRDGPNLPGLRRLKICETAECNSALRLQAAVALGASELPAHGKQIRARGLHDDSVGRAPGPGVPGEHQAAVQGPTIPRGTAPRPARHEDCQIPGGLENAGHANARAKDHRRGWRNSLGSAPIRRDAGRGAV